MECSRALPDACFAAEDLFRAKTNVFDCVFAKQCSDIIATAYDDLDAAVTQAQTFLGPDAVVTPINLRNALLPDGVIGIVGDTAIVWLTGTSTNQQLAVQAFYFGYGPINQGFYSVSGLYETAANAVAAAMVAAGAGTSTRVVLAGHSYGGAVALVLAAKMRLAGPTTREIELLTLGAPKAGDQRLHDLILNMPQTHWVNEGDPIPLLPPSGATMALLALLVSPVLALVWRSFVRPPNVRFITHEGAIVESVTDNLDDSSLYTIGVLIAAAQSIPTFLKHNTDWYGYRLCLACKCVPRPCIEPIVETLTFSVKFEDLKWDDGTTTFTENFTYHLSTDFELQKWSSRDATPPKVNLQTFEPDVHTAAVVLLDIRVDNPIDPFRYFVWTFTGGQLMSTFDGVFAPNEVNPGDHTHFVSVGRIRIVPLVG